MNFSIIFRVIFYLSGVSDHLKKCLQKNLKVVLDIEVSNFTELKGKSCEENGKKERTQSAYVGEEDDSLMMESGGDGGGGGQSSGGGGGGSTNKTTKSVQSNLQSIQFRPPYSLFNSGDNDNGHKNRSQGNEKVTRTDTMKNDRNNENKKFEPTCNQAINLLKCPYFGNYIFRYFCPIYWSQSEKNSIGNICEIILCPSKPEGTWGFIPLNIVAFVQLPLIFFGFLFFMFFMNFMSGYFLILSLINLLLTPLLNPQLKQKIIFLI